MGKKQDTGHDDRPVRRFSAGKKLLFSAITCLIFFSVLELVLWTLGVETILEREDPFRGFSGLVKVFERKGSVYRTRRAKGPYVTFNEQSFAARKPPDGLRIFTLGGSSSYGFPWGADAAFPAALGDVLSAACPDRRVESVNVSGISYGIHRLRFVAREILDYEPDVLIIYSGHNEFIEPTFFNELKNRGPARNRLEYLISHWRLYSAFWCLRERFEEPEEPEAARLAMFVRREQDTPYTEPHKQTIVAEYRKGLEEIVRRAHRRGVKVAVATVPCNLRQWRPEKSIMSAALTDRQRAGWLAAIRSGKANMGAGRFAQAAADLQQALKLGPTHAETHYLLGRAYEGLKEWDMARESYRRACDYDASPVRRISAINDAVRSVAAREGALLVDVDEIFERCDEHGLIGFGLIQDYVHPTLEGHRIIAWHIWQAMSRAGWLGAGGAARRDLFDKVLAERSAAPATRNPVWFYNQAVVLEKQGQLLRAIQRYRQALELDPQYAGACASLSRAHHALGRYGQAEAYARRAVELDPESPYGHANLGVALNSQGNFAEAESCFREALRLKGDFVHAHVNLAHALGAQSKFDEAIAHLQRALEIQPNSARAHNDLGLPLSSLGRFDEAIRHYQKALQIDPEYVPAHVNLGSALASRGQTDQAIHHLRVALAIDPNHPTAHFSLARALASQNQLPQAIRHYREALRVKPDMAPAAINLAWILATCKDAKLRNSAESVKIASHAVQLTRETDPAAFAALAAAYAEAGRFNEASRTAERGLKLIGSNPTPLAQQLRRQLECYRVRKCYRQP